MMNIRWACFILVVGTLGTYCNTKEPFAPKKNETYTLAFGGDFTLGRWLNEALFEEEQRKQIIGDITPFFRDADIALVNGEGVISAGGAYFDKGEPRPFLYRAHPLAIKVLQQGGVDVVAVGNNHFGDYGRGSMMEMLHRLRKAGIDYTGGGSNQKDAAMPAYHRVGDVVVAIVGGDFTLGERFAARNNRPGVVHYKAFLTEEFENEIIEQLRRTLTHARKHAHVVLLSPHWGTNWMGEPTPFIRRLAKRIISSGFDGILGHSAHVYQGVELIDGKPVIYDAGNVVSDLALGGNRQYGFVWRLSFNRFGILSAEATPVHLQKNKTTWVSDVVGKRLLTDLEKKSATLGTPLVIEKKRAILRCLPGKAHSPTAPQKMPSRPVPPSIREEANDTIIDSLPATATPVNVKYPEGITLVGYELLTNKISVPKGGQIIQTYWRTDRKVRGDYRIFLHARHYPNQGTSYRSAAEQHIPGDWLLPTRHWPPGKIVRDRNLLRLKFVPKGDISFFVALMKNNRKLNPLESAVPLEGADLVPIGNAKYEKSAKRLFQYLREYRRKQRNGK